MKKGLEILVAILILIVGAGGLYLWNSQQNLKTSYRTLHNKVLLLEDISTQQIKLPSGQLLVNNEGNPILRSDLDLTILNMSNVLNDLYATTTKIWEIVKP